MGFPSYNYAKETEKQETLNYLRIMVIYLRSAAVFHWIFPETIILQPQKSMKEYCNKNKFSKVCSSHCSHFLKTYFLVLGHHHWRIIMVVLKATVGSTLQQQPHNVHLASATGNVQGCVPTVGLTVDIASILWKRNSCIYCETKHRVMMKKGMMNIPKQNPRP